MKLTIEERRCAACNIDISQKSPRAVFCSKKCRDSPQFWGTFCAQCGGKLFAKKENASAIKTCSAKCRALLKYPSFNENFFAEPNPTNSYWAGLIAADGCIVLDRGYKILHLGLKSQDGAHLEKLQSSIGAGVLQDKATYLESTGKTYGSTAFKLYSEKICQDLNDNFNITPRKSLVLSPPPLEGDCATAFVAGYVDGDGSYVKDRNRPRLTALGTFEMLRWISHVCGIPKVPRKSQNIFIIAFCGNDAIRVRKLFHNLDLPLLERKRNRWEELGANLAIL